ncbi:MAG: RNA-binding protein, partial [Planctomycetes bacterium]|nr:RNA-binding protein [Planctomycetota bacterium]
MGSRIFVGNLSFDTSEQDLHDLFAGDNRPVEKVSIVTDRESGRSRGFAFVEMGAGADTAAVIAAMNGTELHGRQLNVSQAHERAERPRRPGGGGGGFGGG